MIRLYSYFRSSTAYRARIALALKGIAYETVPVNLLKGEQRSAEYLKVNPVGGVPALQDGDFILGQSLAIINYIDNLAPEPKLAPGDFKDQAFARQVALTIAEDIHPLINLKVNNYLADKFGADDAAKAAWYRHWTGAGMKAVETLIARYGRMKERAGNFALGDQVSIADICIVPQMYSMRRMGMALDDYPLCRRIEAHCVALAPFQRAAPETQQDAPADLEPIHGPQAPLLKAAA